MERLILPEAGFAGFQLPEPNLHSSFLSTQDSHHLPLDGILFDSSFGSASDFNGFDWSMASFQPPIFVNMSQPAYTTYPSEVLPQFSSSYHALMDSSIPSCQFQSHIPSFLQPQQVESIPAACDDSKNPSKVSQQWHFGMQDPSFEVTKLSYCEAKRHVCPSCNQSFSRSSDFQRHFENIHLQIRHHCPITGCEDNKGRGYCRVEKMRGHVRQKHGRIQSQG